MLVLDSVSKTYITSRNKQVSALNRVCLELPDCGFYSILGPSGCGKTTLLNLMGTLDKVTEGKITWSQDVKKVEISALTESELNDFRNRNLGFVFQNYNLVEDWSVEQNIRIVLEQQKWETKSENEITHLVLESLSFVGLEGMEKRKIYELSGGQQQRVAIARALIKGPSILLADEPTGNLDSESGNTVMSVLRKCAQRCLVVMVTHDRELAEEYSDCIIQMKNGEIGEITEISCKEKDELVTEICNRENIETSVLDYKTITRLALNAIWIKKIKLILMILIMLIVLGCLRYAATIYTMDIGKTISHYLTSNNIGYYETYETHSLQVENVLQDFEIRNRSEYRSFLDEQFVSDNCFSRLNACVVSNGEEQECVLVVNGKATGNNVIKGSLPQAENEVVISDYLQIILGLSKDCIGTEITINNCSMTICGVEQMNSAQILESNPPLYDDLERIQKEGTRVLVSKQYYEFLGKQQMISLPFAEITDKMIGVSPSDDREYLQSTKNISDDIELCWGRLPERKGEIAISVEYAQKQMLLPYDIQDYEINDAEVSFWNLASNPELNGYLDLYSVVPEITIVGIYTGSQAGITLGEEDYGNVISAFCNNKIYDSVEIRLNEDNRTQSELYKNVYDKKIDTDMGLMSEYTSRYESYKSIRWVYQVIMIIMGTLLGLLMILFFSFNVRDNYHQIGILRSLGVRYTDISKIWLFEAFLICIILEILSTIINGVIFAKINAKFMARLGFVSKLIYHNVSTELIIFGAVMVAAVITVIIPLWLISDYKPIKLLKHAE